jgi:hypothetical protein
MVGVLVMFNSMFGGETLLKLLGKTPLTYD